MAAGLPLASKTTDAPSPWVSVLNLLGEPVGCRVEHVIGTELARELPAGRGGLGHDHLGAVAHGRGHDAEPDRPGSEHEHGVAGVEVVGAHRRVVAAAERLDEGALGPGEVVGEAVEPGLLGDEELGGGTADAEAEVVVPDDALADDAVAHAETLDVAAHPDHLAGPLVAGDDGELEGDDVATGEELEVGVADADAATGDEHLVGAELGRVDLVDAELVRPVNCSARM